MLSRLSRALFSLFRLFMRFSMDILSFSILQMAAEKLRPPEINQKKRQSTLLLDAASIIQSVIQRLHMLFQ